MTTKNPRLTITLEPGLAARIRRLSELTGNSQSGILSELLEGSTEVFDKLIVVLEAAQGAQEAMRGKLAADMEAAQARVESQLGFVMDEFDTFTRPLLDEAEAIKRRARRTGGGARGATRAPASATAVTPPSNRGVRSTTKTRKNPTATKA